MKKGRTLLRTVGHLSEQLQPSYFTLGEHRKRPRPEEQGKEQEQHRPQIGADQQEESREQSRLWQEWLQQQSKERGNKAQNTQGRQLVGRASRQLGEEHHKASLGMGNQLGGHRFQGRHIQRGRGCRGGRRQQGSDKPCWGRRQGGHSFGEEGRLRTGSGEQR